MQAAAYCGSMDENLLVERDGALLFAGLFGLDRSMKALLNAAEAMRAGRRSGDGRAAAEASAGAAVRSKSKSNWRRMGSTMAPRWRKARRVPVRTTRASSSGLDMPATAFMARMDSRMDAAGTSSSRSERKVRSCPRS